MAKKFRVMIDGKKVLETDNEEEAYDRYFSEGRPEEWDLERELFEGGISSMHENATVTAKKAGLS